MVEERAIEFVAECLWPDVRESDLRELDQRVTEAAEQSVAAGRPVRYLGSLLMREDEVVLCLLEGELEIVRGVAVTAKIPFERILEAARSGFCKQTSELRPAMRPLKAGDVSR